MKPSYEFLRLAVLVIAYLLPLAVGDMAMSAVHQQQQLPAARRTQISGGVSRGGGGRLICASPHPNRNEITSFGVLSSSSSSWGQSRRSRKSRLLQARLTAAAAAASTADNEVGGHHRRVAADYAEEGGGGGGEAFWLRNKCHDGFVVVKEKTRVLAQHEGLDKFNTEIKLIKESCVAGDPKTSSLMTRLYSPSQERYICFNRKGKVRAVVS